MALRTELQYEDLFGDLITLLTGLNRDNSVRPMKQANGTRMVERIGALLKGFNEQSNFCTYHVKFEEQNEEPFTNDAEDKVFAKRYLRVEYNFYGPAAANNALMFKQLHYTQKSFDQLNKDNIVYSIARENTLDMDQEFNSKWWTRRNISINYLEDVEIEFPAGIVEEVIQTEVELQLINDLKIPLDAFQILDNRDEMINYDLDNAVITPELYIAQTQGSDHVKISVPLIKPDTWYTLFVNVTSWTATLDNSGFRIIPDGLTTFIDDVVELYAKDGSLPEIGVVKVAFKTSLTPDGNIMYFSTNLGGAGDIIIYKAALVEGIHTSISNSNALEIIETIEYGPTNP